MGINKIVYGGVTKLDISNDTVTPSSLLQGYTAHDNTGALITGTASAGGNTDVTIFTITANDDGTNTVTCNKSFNEARNSGNFGAVAVIDGQDMMFSIVMIQWSNIFIRYAIWDDLEECRPISDIIYNRNGVIEITDSSAFYDDYPTELGSELTGDIITDISATSTPQYLTFYSGQYGGNSTPKSYKILSPSGTAGTPTASKGTVNNHSVSVTPSVTNTTGYILGDTKTGAAVTVSASELVSGTKDITSNGTTDVTNYASVNVDISFSTIYTGTTDPSSSLGVNGDIYLKVVE